MPDEYSCNRWAASETSGYLPDQLRGNMTRVRRLEIRNFRSLQTLDWTPSNGVNCLIGPGDSGKSIILDAIDLCLGARRSATAATAGAPDDRAQCRSRA
ncbi:MULTISPECIES: AAA family ATPase [Burkholderia]|nr:MULTISPECIES: AAA family ATPase [unclassified Burkholderia]